MFHFPIQEITSLDEIPYNKERNTQRCTLPLFHGTRRYAIECPQEDLDNMIRSSKTVVQYCHDNSDLLFSNDTQVRQYKKEHKGEIHTESVGSGAVYQYDAPLYQYNDFYVTNNFALAVKDFTIYGCGEISGLAYANAKYIRDLALSLSDKEVDAAIEYVLKCYPRYYNSEKIVLAIYDFEYDHLRRQSGEKFNPAIPIFIKELYGSIAEDGEIYSQSYRLDNEIGTVTAKLIPEKLFDDAFRKFTDITDVQHYMNSLY